MGLTEWLLPKDKVFFDLLEAESRTVLKGAEILHSLVSKPDSSTENRQDIKEIERKGDMIVREIYERLNKSFITPIDHEDLGKLATLFDDVLDLIYATANRLHLYKIVKSTEALTKFAEITLNATRILDESLTFMRQLKADELQTLLTEINRLEKEGDELLNKSVAKLFDKEDTISIIKLKEIYETFELVTDKCEDVATLLRDIVIKNG